MARRGNAGGWSGRRAQRALDWCKQHYGWTCWICGHLIDEGDYSVDHIIERSLRPDLTWEPSNWRPAHLRKHPEFSCPGNSGRSNQRQPKLMPEWTAPGW